MSISVVLCSDVSIHTVYWCAFPRFEKLISGKYLGSITHAALLILTQDKVLFGGVCSEKFSELVIDRFDSAFLSVVEGEK